MEVPVYEGECMKDIGFFPTEYGVASLILREIPYRSEAYIRVMDVRHENLGLLLKECAEFCRVCGAQKILWTGVQMQEPAVMQVLRMQGQAWADPGLLENLFPVTEKTVSKWREIYNHRMRSVPQAATLSFAEETRIVRSGGAYFIHHNGDLLGIGWLEGTKLLAIAASQPGAGERVAHTLMSLVEGKDMTLEVASTNQRALKLYRKLGFVPVSVVSSWYEYKYTDDK